jgi:hypothetical protein
MATPTSPLTLYPVPNDNSTFGWQTDRVAAKSQRRQTVEGVGTREILSTLRLIRASLGLGLLLMFGFARPAFAQSGCMPSATQMCLDNTYFVTGDYVVGGVGLRGLGDASGFASGTISIPDGVQAKATGVASPSVPAGASIVAAVLYWETVESGLAGSPTGQQGFFGPANADGSPISSYPITGAILGNPKAPTSWSSGGCSGNSQGSKTMRAYRADVRPYLPLDANGNIQANGYYQVKLPDSGSNGGGTPLTLGATLVIIYRVLSPSVQLNSIVIYDGSVAPNNSSSTMTLPIVGFYQAASTVAKITHIVGNGQPNKSEIVSLNNTNLPSLYGALPPFPGIYNGSWDNPTWTSNGAVNADAFQATTSVMPTASNSGCVNWGAVIFSTTVPDSDGDGLLDVWKTGIQGYPGYFDVFSNQWVALPGAQTGAQDIFIEGDYLSDLDGSAGLPDHSHLPKQAALDEVGDAFSKHGIKLHFDLGPGIYSGDKYVVSYPISLPTIPNGFFPPPKTVGGNVISESAVQCTDTGAPPYCPFPGTPTVGWKEGLLFVRDSATLPLGNSNTAGGSFQPGRTLSYHYILFGHALGEPRSFWSTAGTAPALIGSGVAALSSIVVKNNVATVTLTSPPGYLKPGDCPDGTILACGTDKNLDRVTVGGALGQFALNGVYLFSGASSTTMNGVSTTTFTINTSKVPDGTYTYGNGPANFNEPQLAVAYAGPTGTSGHSDFGGGGDSAVTFGLWGADDPAGCQPDPSVALVGAQVYCNNETGTVQEQAGTLMHELGHTLALTHGGTYYLDPQHPYVPTYGLNCKPNDLTAMSYLFQIRGFPDNPNIVDYSGQVLPDLNEKALSEQNGLNYANVAHLMRWYASPNSLDTKVGQFALSHCDGTPKAADETAVRVDQTALANATDGLIDWNNDLTIEAGTITQDVNFTGTIGGDSPSSGINSFLGINEWQGAANGIQQAIDLRQIDARASAFAFSGEGGQSLGGGGQSLGGGGQSLGGGGQSLGGGGQSFGGGGQSLGGGGQSLGGGGQSLGGGGSDQDEDTANSTVDAPQKLTSKVVSKSVVLNWNPPSIGQIHRYSIWRAVGSFPTPAKVAANFKLFSNGFCGQQNCYVQGNPTPAPTTYTDNTVKNNTTYTYFVTDTNKQGATSGASAPTVITVHF